MTDPPREPEPPARAHEITLEQALEMAMRHHRSGRLPEAEHIYGKILEAVPDQVDALHFSGIVAHQLGRSEEGIRRIQAAIEAAPDNAGMHSNLGRVLAELGRRDEAHEAFERAIAIAPGRAASAWNNLGTLYKKDSLWSRAAECFQNALRDDPDHADAYQNLGSIFRRTGQHDEAAECFRRAVALRPDAAENYQNLSQALWRAGREKEARAAVAEWLAYAPSDPVARHLASAFGLAEAAPRASDEFVSEHFDQHAATFDEHLEELEYRAPALVAVALEEVLGESARFERVLDAGCGTGLCGPFLRPWARRLVGVDLSAGMLAQARDRGYDELQREELGAHLSRRPFCYDAIVSADTLCYFGDLCVLSERAFSALVPGGWFLFTVESLDALEPDRTSLPRAEPPSDPSAHGFRLLFHGRYAHAASHVRGALAEAGFTEIVVRPEVLRMEVGEPVQGWLVRARRPARAV